MNFFIIMIIIITVSNGDVLHPLLNNLHLTQQIVEYIRLELGSNLTKPPSSKV